MNFLSVNTDNLNNYIVEINKFPVLTLEEEKKLIHNISNNSVDAIKSAHKIVTSHLRLVVKIAFGYKGYGLPMMDLISEGNIGLMKAVKKFDKSKECRVSTYATFWIQSSIKEYIVKSWSLVKIGTTVAQKKLFFNLRKLIDKISDDNQYNSLSDLEIDHISKDLSVSKKEVVDTYNRLFNKDVSLNVPAGNMNSEIINDDKIDFIESENNQFEELIEKDNSVYQIQLLNEAISKLNEREKEIIKARRLDNPVKTLSYLASKFNISIERVRQIENDVLNKLKNYFYN